MLLVKGRWRAAAMPRRRLMSSARCVTRSATLAPAPPSCAQPRPFGMLFQRCWPPRVSKPPPACRVLHSSPLLCDQGSQNTNLGRAFRPPCLAAHTGASSGAGAAPTRCGQEGQRSTSFSALGRRSMAGVFVEHLLATFSSGCALTPPLLLPHHPLPHCLGHPHRVLPTCLQRGRTAQAPPQSML